MTPITAHVTRSATPSVPAMPWPIACPPGLRRGHSGPKFGALATRTRARVRSTVRTEPPRSPPPRIGKWPHPGSRRRQPRGVGRRAPGGVGVGPNAGPPGTHRPPPHFPPLVPYRTPLRGQRSQVRILPRVAETPLADWGLVVDRSTAHHDAGRPG